MKPLKQIVQEIDELRGDCLFANSLENNWPAISKELKRLWEMEEKIGKVEVLQALPVPDTLRELLPDEDEDAEG